MGRITATKKLIAEDFAAQRPWIDKLIAPLNAFFEQVYFTLVSGVTIRENLKAKVFEYTLPIGHDYTKPVSFNWAINERPTIVTIGQIREIASDPAVIGNHSIEWVFNSLGQVDVLFNGLVNTKQYSVRLVGIV